MNIGASLFHRDRVAAWALAVVVTLLLSTSAAAASGVQPTPIDRGDRTSGPPGNSSVTGIDLDVTYISRTPRYDWHAAKKWPDPGELVTFTAHVINKGSSLSGSFSFEWRIDGQLVESGSIGGLGSHAESSTALVWAWQTGRHVVSFKADSQQQVPETAENNNELDDFTDAMSVAFWVEQGVYEDFNSKQNGIGTYSWEDWAQYQIKTFNNLLRESQFPQAPQGVLTRLRLDKVTLAPDHTLNDLNAQHAPIESETDVQWGFPVEWYLNCPWLGCYDICWSLHHELGHYLFGRVDLYGLDVQGGDVDVRNDAGQLIAGTPLLPYIRWDVVHYNSHTDTDLMATHLSDPIFLSEHTVYSLNRDWPQGQRTHRRWTYIFDLPSESKLKILDNDDMPIPNVQISVYQAVQGDGSSGPYSQFFDNVPDIMGTTDAQGLVSLGAKPFGNLENYWGLTSGVILVKLVHPTSGQTRYVWVEVVNFNLAYWRGETASYTHSVHFPEGPQGFRLSQSDLIFSTYQGANPIPQHVDVTVFGEGIDQRWSISKSTVPWLRTIPYSNNTENGFYSDSLTFVVDSANLAPGTYTTEVVLTMTEGGSSPQIISVVLTILNSPGNRTLTVSKSGSGSGTVISSPAGINCGTDCSESYLHNTTVILTANPDVGSAFAGWGGACSGTGSCMVTMTTARNVTASFVDASAVCPPIAAWKGEYWANEGLSGAPSLCRDDPEVNFDWGMGSPDPLIPPEHFSARWTRELEFTSSGRYQFSILHDDGARLYVDGLLVSDWWDTCCVVHQADVTLSAGVHTIRAEMHEIGGAARMHLWWELLPPLSYELTVGKAGFGNGMVTSSPAGINCGTDCSESYTSGTVVMLTAKASAGSTFVGWSGACSGTTCSVTMDTGKSVTASFVPIQTAQFLSIYAQDGWVLESGEFNNTGRMVNSAATTIPVGDDAADRQYRAILSFNTANLPDNAVITGVTLKIKSGGLPVGTNPFSTHGKLLVDVRKGCFSNNCALQLTDFQAAASKLGVMPITNKPINGWYSGTMPKTGFAYINRTGVTQVRLRFALDDNDDLGADYLRFYSGNAIASVRPQLIIEYYVP